MAIKLSDKFSYKRLLRFTFPSILMMIVSSIYGVVDGFFVSNYAGETPFAAVNFIMPFLMILISVGFIFGSGGSAYIAKLMGEGDRTKANKVFSLLIYVSIGASIVLMIAGIFVVRPIAALLGAEGEMLENCVTYSRIVLLGLPMVTLQMEFQSFFITAEKPRLGLIVTLLAGVTNIVLDGLLVAAFDLGLEGAAIATVVSQAVGGGVPLIYFGCKNSSMLKLTKTHFDGKAILKTCTNGSSELMSNVSMSLVGMLYNMQLMRYAGEGGVAAYGVLMYVSMIFSAAFIGYAVGIAPIVSYHYGAQNREELKSLRKKSLIIIGIFSAIMVALSLGLSSPLSQLFVGYNAELCEMTVNAFKIYSFAFLFMGFAIFSSAFFTALNDGLTSALISFLRTLVFQIAAVFLLPLIFELNGIWVSIVVAEFMAVAVSVVFLLIKRKKYGY